MMVALKNGEWPLEPPREDPQDFIKNELHDFDPKARILTDDWAPVDYFLSGIL